MLGAPVVSAITGGAGGGGATLTDAGRIVLARYRRIEQRATKAAATELEALRRLRGPRARLKGHSAQKRSPKQGETIMKLSARNQIRGIVAEVKKGQTTAHIRISVSAGVVITASITNEAVDDLNLKAGDEAIAIIKASDVMVAK